MPESFTELSIPSVLDTSTKDLIGDFFVPLLSRAVKYDRGVGYFSSGWFKTSAEGMFEFANNGGAARWVTSPILSERDWDAIIVGDAAKNDSIIRKILEQAVKDLERALKEDTLSALAWMIADNVIDLKLAMPRSKLEGGEFHDKFGIFTDQFGNRVSFNGSYNDSIQGLRNYESIKVFCSWNSAYSDLVEADIARFEMLWDGRDPNVEIFDLPKAIKEKIVKLRKNIRPYPDPDESREGRYFDSIELILDEPRIPELITLRDYQNEAIEAWFSSGHRGLLEMATGTGKTITSLAASVRLYEQEGPLALVIAAPFQHLVDQWQREASRFRFLPILAYKSKNTWIDRLSEAIMAFNQGDSKTLCVITTHTTFATDHFQELVQQIEGNRLLIADEVHHMGAKTTRNYLPAEMPYRLALSATPDRWYDDEGTAELHKYFGSTVYSFSLADAIGVTLSTYYYYPVLVDLTVKEMEEYRELSGKIARLFHAKNIDREEVLTKLLIKRADLLNRAENKLSVLGELVDREPNLTHSLFYCAPGQIDEVVHLLGWEKRLRVHRFTAREDTRTRQQLLNDFSDGKLQGLVAMHCLDEGVDVPNTRKAYILASSSNPRQFIQRRGRILRKAKGKKHAYIFDLVTVPPPPEHYSEETTKSERSILKRELRRFVEFASSAQNTQEAYQVIWGLAEDFGILDLQFDNKRIE